MIPTGYDSWFEADAGARAVWGIGVEKVCCLNIDASLCFSRVGDRLKCIG